MDKCISQSIEEINFIEKISILKLLFNEYKTEGTDLGLKFEKIKFFNYLKINEFSKINDNKKKMFALLNALKYLLTTKDQSNFKYQLINMEDLPEYSPYIQSEIIFRNIISNLKDNSKLSFFYLQLNSGGGLELISSKTYYKIKMIPLLSIKNHILNEDFYPYFFIYSSSLTNNLAFNNPQTQIKSYNEFYLRKGEENISLHRSDSNTAKILFIKFHGYSHLKYSGDYKMNTSPQFIFKNNLSILNNDISIPLGLLDGKLKYENKKYFTEFRLPKLNENIVDDDQYFIQEQYQNGEDADEDDEFNGKLAEKNFGESGFAIEYYLCGNYYCSNGIVKFNGNLKELLNVNLYIGESLIEVKRIIENKIKFLFGQKQYGLINNSQSLNILNFRPVRKDPYKMYSYRDLGILVNV